MLAPMKRVELPIKVFNRNLDGYVIYSADSAWIWVGDRKINSIGLAHFPLFTMLEDGENTQREFIKSISLRLTKKSKFTQIFFTTDIETEDAEFWKELNNVLGTQLVQLTTEN